MKRSGNLAKINIIIGVIATLLSGCAANTTVPASTKVESSLSPTAKSQATQTKTENTAVAPEPQFLSGKVIETMNATGYTYVLLEKDAKKAWFAVPTTSVSVGQEIEFRPGVQMGLFRSKTLNKSFENIVFAPGLVIDPKAQPLPVAVSPVAAPEPTVNDVPPGHPSLNADPKAFDGKATREQLRKAGISVITGKVLETMNAVV